MRVLVTGGAGFIGSHVVDRLLAAGNEVIVVDDLSSGLEDNVSRQARLIVSDIANPGIREALAAIGFDSVVHCAAQASVVGATMDPARDASVNIVGSVNVIEGAIRAGAKRFIYVNTGGALYSHPTRIPTDETSAIQPISAYGLSKSVVESYLRLLAPFDPWWTSLRLANVYGPRQRPDGEGGVVSIFCQRMVAHQLVEIHGDGEQTRDFIFVEDVAEACLMALGRPPVGPTNIGTGRSTSVNELFALLARRIEYEPGPQPKGARPGDVRHSALDSSRARRVLGWAPRVALEEGLDRTIEWHRASRDPSSL